MFDGIFCFSGFLLFFPLNFTVFSRGLLIFFIRKAEKLRRELEARVEDALAEATKERKLRERSEEYCRQMQAESDRLRVRNEGSPRDQQESNRLKADLEKLEVNEQRCYVFFKILGCFFFEISRYKAAFLL